MVTGDGADMRHETELDGAGWSSWPRLTCCTCNGETLLRAPYMTFSQWKAKVAKFAVDHPSKVATSYLQSLEVRHE